MLDISKLTPEEKEKRIKLYKEYEEIRSKAMEEYKKEVAPLLKAYQDADQKGWDKICEIERPIRQKVIEFDNYLESIHGSLPTTKRI
jgi:hypothetical protein